MGHRPLPGRMQPHMGMMAPGPMLPQRIGTPPSVPPMAMARSHTPSPETVLPVSSHSSAGTARAEDTQTKSTSQQGTQTVSTKKKPSSRPSSRRNSEDKTAQSPQGKKKEEVKVEKETTNKETSSKETTSKETTVLKQAPQPQRQRQGMQQMISWAATIYLNAFLLLLTLTPNTWIFMRVWRASKKKKNETSKQSAL